MRRTIAPRRTLSSPRGRTWVYVLLAGVSAGFLSGCLSMGASYVPIVDYSVRPRPQVEPAAGSEYTLGIRPLQPAEHLRRGVTYRQGEYVLREYAYAEWAEPPRDVVTRALLDALSATGHFKDVGDARDLRPDFILTGHLREFEEVRTDDGAVARITVRLELRTAARDRGLWSETLTFEAPTDPGDPAALAAALSEATARMVEQAAAAIVQNTGGNGAPDETGSADQPT